MGKIIALFVLGISLIAFVLFYSYPTENLESWETEQADSLFVSVPKDTVSMDLYVLVIDQQLITSEFAALIVQMYCTVYPLNSIYWVFSLDDLSYYDMVQKIDLPDSCEIVMINDLYYGLSEAKKTLDYTKGKKYLIFIGYKFSWETENFLDSLKTDSIKVLSKDLKDKDTTKTISGLHDGKPF